MTIIQTPRPKQEPTLFTMVKIGKTTAAKNHICLSYKLFDLSVFLCKKGSYLSEQSDVYLMSKREIIRSYLLEDQKGEAEETTEHFCKDCLATWFSLLSLTTTTSSANELKKEEEFGEIDKNSVKRGDVTQ
jgi:hypothetical protein